MKQNNTVKPSLAAHFSLKLLKISASAFYKYNCTQKNGSRVRVGVHIQKKLK